MNFEAARKLCQSHQMQMLKIESKAELDFVFDFLTLYKHTTQVPNKVLNHIDFWTGGKKIGEKWYWVDRQGGNRDTSMIDEDIVDLSSIDEMGGSPESSNCLQITEMPTTKPGKFTSFDCDHKIHASVPVCEAYLPPSC